MLCENCGTSMPSGTDTCAFCGQPIPQQPAASAQTSITHQKSENMITGIVGALIGAAIGGGAIILISQIGYVASLSGLILAVCTLKGYELLGRQLSTKGIIICIILILITPYIANRLDWAITINENFSEFSIGESFAAVPAFISVGAIEASSYFTNLLMIYGFAALGAFSTLRDLFRK